MSTATHSRGMCNREYGFTFYRSTHPSCFTQHSSILWVPTFKIEGS